MHDCRAWSLVVLAVLTAQPITGLLVLPVIPHGRRRRSRTQSLCGSDRIWPTTWWTSAVVVFLALNSPGIVVVRVIVIALLISNLRATWIAGHWKPESEEAALPPRLGDTLADKFPTDGPRLSGPKSRWFITSSRSECCAHRRRTHHRALSAASTSAGDSREIDYFPMQKVLKIKFKISSVVVAPVIASSGRKAL